MTGNSAPNSNQLSTRRAWKDKLTTIQTANARDGDSVGDKWHPPRNESRPFSVFPAAGLTARGVRLIGRGLRSSAFTAPDARLW